MVDVTVVAYWHPDSTAPGVSHEVGGGGESTVVSNTKSNCLASGWSRRRILASVAADWVSSMMSGSRIRDKYLMVCSISGVTMGVVVDAGSG
jgi:hypothetical protein